MKNGNPERKIVATLILAAGLALFGSAPSLAQSTYLDRFAPPGDPNALPPFTELRMKPVGRVGSRAEMEADINMHNTRGKARVTLEGYAIIEADGTSIRRTDKVGRVSFDLEIPSRNLRGGVVADFDGITYLDAVMSPRNEFKSFKMLLSAKTAPKTLRATGAIKESDAREILGSFLVMAVNVSSNTIVLLPEKPVAIGDLLLDLTREEYKQQLATLMLGDSFKVAGDRSLSASDRQKIVDQTDVREARFSLTLRGVTRFRNLDLLDYRGPIAVYMKYGQNEAGGEGEARALIDPATGLVRAYIFDGKTTSHPADGPSATMDVRYMQETIVEDKIAAPLPQPSAQAVSFKPAAPGSTANTATSLPPVRETTELMSSSDIYDKSVGSVVVVEFPGGHGSGFYIADDVIVTNAHVVGNESRVKIRIGNKVASGVVIKVNKDADIAFVKTAKGPKPLPLANDIPRTGELALVIGAPLYEDLAGTLTGGLVSSTRFMYGYKWVQTDAPISSGNSGGPVLDAKGRVIGMATFSAIAPTDENHAEGLNFAISAVDIRKFYGL